MSGQGISYPPPTENLPTFDSSVFKVNNDPLTIQEGLNYFLAFPDAQGTENLNDINVGGVATFYNNIVMSGTGDYLQFPDGTQQTTAGGGGGALLSSNNTWTGTNAYNQNPTTSATQTYPETTNLTRLSTIGYCNSSITNLLSSNNTWSGQNYFEGEGPSTITIKDGSSSSGSFPISITSTGPPFYGLQIAGGGLFIGNNQGSAESSNFIYLSCDDTNNNQLNILGDVKIINNANDLYNATLSATGSLGLTIDKQLTIQAGLNINPGDGTYYTLIPQSGSETLVISGNLKMTGEETYIAFPYTSNDDIQMYQNYDGNMVIYQGGLVVSRIPTTTTPVSNSVLIIADENINNQLDIEGTIAITTSQTYPQTTNTNQLATIGYVNSAASGGGSGLLSSNNTWTGENSFQNTTKLGQNYITQLYSDYNGLTINKGVTIQNQGLNNPVTLLTDGTITGQLNIFGSVTTNATQTYPQTTNTTQLATIGYVNAGISSVTTNIIGSYNSSGPNTTTNPAVWTFDNIPTTLGSRIGFIVYCNQGASNPSSYPNNAQITMSGMTNFMCCNGVATLIPFQYYSGGTSTQQYCYMFNAPVSIGGTGGIVFATYAGQTATQPYYTLTANNSAFTTNTTLTMTFYNITF